MKVQLTDVRGKKVVFEMQVPDKIARLLVRRDQTVEYEGIQYGFLSSTKERARYGPMLPPAQLSADMLIKEAAGA
jgi:hypothetical protein